MSQHLLSVYYVDVLPVLGIVLAFFVGLRLGGVSFRECFSHATLTVTGYLRRRPDPAVEHALRTAFAEVDRELAGILGDRTRRSALDR
jgi:hypothetical protein